MDQLKLSGSIEFLRVDLPVIEGGFYVGYIEKWENEGFVD